MLVMSQWRARRKGRPILSRLRCFLLDGVAPRSGSYAGCRSRHRRSQIFAQRGSIVGGAQGGLTPDAIAAHEIGEATFED